MKSPKKPKNIIDHAKEMVKELGREKAIEKLRSVKSTDMFSHAALETQIQWIKTFGLMDMGYSPTEFHLISHALGINFYHSLMSENKKDKELPKEFYRNYYQSISHPDWERLVEKKFAVKEERMNQLYYFVTDLGMRKFRREFKTLITDNYVPVKERNLEYLKDRIDLYIKYHAFYTFDHKHVITEYLEKASKGVYISHTTADCIQVFKRELKKYLLPQLLSTVEADILLNNKKIGTTNSIRISRN